MKEIFKKIINCFKKIFKTKVPPPKKKPKLRKEIDHLQKVIEKNDKILEEISNKYHPPDYCCATCVCGTWYTKLIEKQERREKWLRILEERYNREKIREENRRRRLADAQQR